MGLTYNPKNEDIFDIDDEKTNHKTNYKTNYPTSTKKVTKTTKTWGKTSCAIRIFGRCVRHNRGWIYKTVPDYDKIKRNKEMNKDNEKRNKARKQ